MTAGLANPVVATVETVGATGIAILAVAVPLLCLAAIVALLYWTTKKAGRLLFGRSRDGEAPQA
jgi:flagellar biosynthesis/type III secretory pathway M-ring protein FliF/YscJ